MSYAQTSTVGLIGVEGHVIQVQAHLSMGLPAFIVVGLPDISVKESKDRLRAAIASSGIEYPQGKITINLHPAELPKRGSGFDLAIAAAVLKAQYPDKKYLDSDAIYLGELGLEGHIYPVRGVLPAVLAAQKAGYSQVVVAKENAAEASFVDGVKVVSVATLRDMATWLDIPLNDLKKPHPPQKLPLYKEAEQKDTTFQFDVDMGQVLGQEDAKKALTIAAAGGHHIFFFGAPGCGKTMLARCLPTILPQLTKEESLEVTAIHSLMGMVGHDQQLICQPPFVAPHHSASLPAIIGGGVGLPRPGAVSLAHRGVLFLDETPEFSRSVIESLRQPLEHGSITLHRAKAHSHFPAQFQLVLAANPCPCSSVSGGRTCTCSPIQKRRYAAKISGPILDRIDISCHMRTVKTPLVDLEHSSTSSHEIRLKVEQARARAVARWGEFGLRCNREIPSSEIRSGKAQLDPKLRLLLDDQLVRGVLSMRGADKIVRLAWTLADLEGRNHPHEADIKLAFHYHSKEVLL